MVSCFNSAWTKPSASPPPGQARSEPAVCHFLTAPWGHLQAPTTPARHSLCLHSRSSATLCDNRIPLTCQPEHQDSGCHQQLDQLGALYLLYLPVHVLLLCDDVALKNFTKYFLHQKEPSEKLMKLSDQQSGQIFLQAIKKPDCED